MQPVWCTNHDDIGLRMLLQQSSYFRIGYRVILPCERIRLFFNDVTHGNKVTDMSNVFGMSMGDASAPDDGKIDLFVNSNLD